MTRQGHIAVALLLILFLSLAQPACRKQTSIEFIIASAPLIALTHVRVIDGTGSPAKEDQTILIEAGRIKAIGDASGIVVPGGAKVFDLRDHTAIPGLVGMHEHLFYTTDAGKRDVSATQTFPRLYLAAGVTTIRTAGTLNLDGDLSAKQSIDAGDEPGPKIYLSSPYINRHEGELLTAQKINAAVDEWTAKGVSSLKVYTNIGRDELAAAVAAGHRHGLKVTGHLCAVGFREAVAAGIDNLEHGLLVDTEFYSGKQFGKCPERKDVFPELVRVDIKGPQVQQLIQELVERRVAVTSTLAIFETYTGNQFELDPRMQQVLTPQAYESCLSQLQHDRSDSRWAEYWQPLLKKEMEFEREFVRSGGLLLAGVDPTGWGGVVAGFGDQRQMELLVQAGFSPEEAIKIYTANGAQFLGGLERIGTLAVGKQADVVIIHGNPGANIKDIRNVTMVFKDGVGYDSAKLIDSVRGQVGAQ
ncbi:MAG: amidohydrolase family protein [bacterium]